MFSFEQGYSFCKFMCKKIHEIYLIVVHGHFPQAKLCIGKEKNVQIHKHTLSLLHLHCIYLGPD